MPKIIVGGRPCQVGWAEYLAAIMPKNTPVEFRDQDGRCGTGVFLYSWHYDGVIAEIETGTGVRTAIHFGYKSRAKLKRLRDTSLLCGAGMGGEGI